jgi:hypothetical protein
MDDSSKINLIINRFITDGYVEELFSWEYKQFKHGKISREEYLGIIDGALLLHKNLALSFEKDNQAYDSACKYFLLICDLYKKKADVVKEIEL